MSVSTPEGLIRNTLWNGIGRIVTIGISLFLTPYILGRVGQEAFGLWALANLLVGYMSLADLGIQSSLVRQISYARPDENPAQFHRIVSTSFLFYLGLFVLLSPPALLLGPLLTRLFTIPEHLRAEAEFVLTFVAVSLFLSIALAVFSTILPALQRMDVANKLAMVISAVNLSSIVFVLENGWGVRGLVVSTLAVKGVGAGLYYFTSQRLFPGLRVSPRHFRWDVWKDLFSFGWKIQVARLCEILAFSFDRVFLSVFGGVGALGRYQPAVQVATQGRMAPHILVSAALPYASELSALKDRRALLNLYLRGTLYLSFVSFAILGFVAAAAPFLTTVWLGPGYSDVALWIRIFCLGYLVNAPLSLGGLVTQAIGRPGLQARSAALATVLNLSLSPVGFLIGGVTGLTVGASLSIVVASVWFLNRLHQALAIATSQVLRESFARPALYLLIPATVLSFVSSRLSPLAIHVADSVVVLSAFGLVFALCVVLAATRIGLWDIRKLLDDIQPSAEAE